MLATEPHLNGKHPAAPGVEPVIAAALHWFEPITLEKIAAVALQDRHDTKYVLTRPQLVEALAAVGDAYTVLEVAGRRVSRYRTQYFDTAAFDLYLAHHNGNPRRYKVRSRTYVETAKSFVEVKYKGKRWRTLKTRAAAEGRTLAAGAAAALVARHPRLAGLDLRPAVLSSFSRITLASRHRPERVTIDVNLSYAAEGRQMALPGVVIAEVKQSGLGRTSAFGDVLRRLGVRPRGFSKYCVGVALLYAGIKRNRFKRQLRLVEEMAGGRDDV